MSIWRMSALFITPDENLDFVLFLQASFPTLIHLVKLDLSKNQLKELPVHFGDLRNLKHLDLYSNQVYTQIVK